MRRISGVASNQNETTICRPVAGLDPPARFRWVKDTGLGTVQVDKTQLGLPPSPFIDYLKTIG
jgi:hypothetical protein